jgi:hypothetical protein
VASNSKRLRWWPRREDESLVRFTVALTGWGATTVIGELLRLAATWLKGHGRGTITATTFTSTTAGWPRRWCKWMSDRAQQCPKLIPSAKFFTHHRYLHFIEHESQRRRRSWRVITDGEGAESGIMFSLLYYQSPFNRLIEQFAAPKSQNSM